ncbi:MAG: xanthine dehydrogenase family protein subunit M [Alphaproteobacteria bacterium]|jgi:carbon-monoxide dehydrogenase medium subunit|nr:xanthine dehydrogenase family protein subunit M [Alphaproteobacteria bacterium]
MYNFNYQRPSSLADAAAALKSADDGAIMAGGQTLLPTLKQRLASPSDVIDIGRIAELSGIGVDGGTVTIGATTRHAEVCASADVQGAIAALAACAGLVGDPQVRNMGTLGGSIANNDPAADYPAAVLGLGATIQTSKREIGADDFFTGLFETALDEDEIIKAVTFPVPEKAGYAKFPQPASRFAMVGVFVAQGSGGVRVAVTGAGPCVFRASDMEAALGGNFAASALDGIQVSADGMNSDIHGSAEYRAHLVGVMAKRAVDVANG